MSDLPKGWLEVKLKEISKIEWGNTNITKKSYVEKGFPAFSASGQDGFLETAEWSGQAVILSAIGARCGKCFFADSEWTAIKNTIVIQGNSEFVNHKLLFYYLNSEERWEISGSGQPFITMGTANEVLFPFPPLNEQKRIVEKLEKLLDKVDTVQARLDKIPVILKRFRQAVLAAACSGGLLGKLNNNIADSTIKDITKKLITGPFGSSLHKADYIYGGTPVINPMSMIDGKIIPSEKMSIDEKTKTRLAKYTMKKGEIVIARRGELGRCAEITQKEEGWLCGTGSALLTLKDNALPTFIQMVISSPTSREYLSEQSVGTTMENLNQKLFLEMPIYLPPLEEQKEIVRRVEDLFKFADQIEARYKKARSYTDKLTQSILAKAFRGELVPQDERDEPARMLLERIKAQGNGNDKANSKQKNKPQKKGEQQTLFAKD